MAGRTAGRGGAVISCTVGQGSQQDSTRQAVRAHLVAAGQADRHVQHFLHVEAQKRVSRAMHYPRTGRPDGSEDDKLPP